jgi:ATP-binding cassette, subfamily B, multidrug efflux pump
MTPWRYLRRYRARVGIGVFMLLATNVLFLAEPILLGETIDALQGDDAASEVPVLVLLMIVFAAATAITRIISRITLFNAARMAEHDLRGELFGRLLRFEPAFYRTHPTGDVMSRLTSDVQTVRAMWGPGVLNIVNTAVAFASVLTMMILVDPMLTLWAVLPYPSMVLLGRLFGRRMYKTSRAVQIQLGEVSQSVQEDLTGVGIIKTYTLEEPRRERFRVMSRRLLHRNMDLTNARGQLIPVLTGLASIGTLIVLYVGGKAVIEGRIGLGDLVEFNSYLARLVWPTLALGWMMSLFQRGLASWQRLEEILRAQPAILDGPGPDPADIRGDLEIRDLTLEIDGKTILDHINLRMPAGTVTAIVGRTGSGKSTLVEAIPRLIDVPPGAIFLDGHDITTLSLATLRHAIGYAPQEAFLFSTTIARNIAFGYERGKEGSRNGGDDRDAHGRDRRDDPQEDARPGQEPARDPARDPVGAGHTGDQENDQEIDSRLVHAAAAAGLARDLAALPEGYDTVVGERGITLSGGQRQRVALARALATRPRVLILDDSLSSVDAETERDILGHLKELMQGRTALLISHRVAAVKRADQIVVLDQGKVVEAGTHEELLAAGGVYAEVYQSQIDLDDLPADIGAERADRGGRP